MPVPAPTSSTLCASSGSTQRTASTGYDGREAVLQRDRPRLDRRHAQLCQPGQALGEQGARPRVVAGASSPAEYGGELDLRLGAVGLRAVRRAHLDGLLEVGDRVV